MWLVHIIPASLISLIWESEFILLISGFCLLILKHSYRGFPGGSVVKNLPANAGDMRLIPGPGTFGEGNGTLVFLPEEPI